MGLPGPLGLAALGELRRAFEQGLFSALFSAVRSVCTVVIYPPEQDGKLTRANNDIRDAAVARVKLISNAVQASLTGLARTARLDWPSFFD